MPDTDLSFARTFPLFEPALILSLEKNGVLSTYAPGEKLVRKGQYFRSSFIVLEGLVKVYREDEEGNEFFIYFLQPGQACALSMVCASRRQTSQIMAVALTESKLLSIPFEISDDWMTKYKSWNDFILSTYRARFEELLETLDHVVFRNMDERLEFYLKRQAEKLGNRLQLTHQQIAGDLNSSREVISRLLKNMENDQRLVLHRNMIEWIK